MQLQHCYSTTVEQKTSEVEPGDKVGLLLRDFLFMATQGGIGFLFRSGAPSKKNVQCDYMDKRGAERHFKFIRIQTGAKSVYAV